VEAGSVAAEMSPIELSAIVADSAELYEPVADEAGMVLTSEIEPSIEIQGNRELIGQAIFNLLDNAIKYSADTEGAGAVSVKLSRRPDGICLSVADHGPGVPLDRREDVVKRFVRLDESRSKPGTGLGLSLVEAIMELHGGTLELSDTDSGNAQRPGLTVSMVFPARAA
jgi:signal transduction histidine kinase